LPSIDDEHIELVLEEYLRLLQAELSRADNYRVLPGVTKLLDSLAGIPNLAIGLGTGNVRRGAYAKLARGALDGAFAFGGFGCDAEDRIELLRAGAVRGAEQLGVPLDSCRVVVIGDTPKDVAAAKGIGAPCIGVETGGFTTADLTACGAQRVFATLAEDGVRDALFETK
jgi:phosphoglycolate phosphatase-like HAD superfamily hydrolase